jgi:hypothetical protein
MTTVEEFIEYQEDHYADKRWIMIEFAKYHVKEALKCAEERCITQADSILNAYPLENIR